LHVRLNESINREYKGIGSAPVKSMKAVLALYYRYYQDLIEDTVVDGHGGPSERTESQNKMTSRSSSLSSTRQDPSKNPVPIPLHALIPLNASGAMKTRKREVDNPVTHNLLPNSIDQVPANLRGIQAPRKRKNMTAEVDGNPEGTVQENHKRVRGRPRGDKQKPYICPVAAMENALAYTAARREASERVKGTDSLSNSSLTDSAYVPDGGSNLPNSTTLPSSSSSPTLNPSHQSLIPLNNVTKIAATIDSSLSNALNLPGTKNRPAKKKAKTAAAKYRNYFNLYWIKNSRLPCIYYDIFGGEDRDRFKVLPICCDMYHYDVQVESVMIPSWPVCPDVCALSITVNPFQLLPSSSAAIPSSSAAILSGSPNLYLVIFHNTSPFSNPLAPALSLPLLPLPLSF
jgi:hypothetical protein